MTIHSEFSSKNVESELNLLCTESFLITLQNHVKNNLINYFKASTKRPGKPLVEYLSKDDIVLQNFLISTPEVYQKIAKLVNFDVTKIPKYYFLDIPRNSSLDYVELLNYLPPPTNDFFNHLSSITYVLKFNILDI